MKYFRITTVPFYFKRNTVKIDLFLRHQKQRGTNFNLFKESKVRFDFLKIRSLEITLFLTVFIQLN